jgi:hypothetical protein
MQCFAQGTVADAQAVLTWITTHDQLLEEHNFDRLKEIVYERYKELKIEPPLGKRVERLVRSAVRSADERLYRKILSQVTPEVQGKLDVLISENAHLGNASLLSDLKSEAGAATLENVLSEIAKLERIRALSLGIRRRYATVSLLRFAPFAQKKSLIRWSSSCLR